MHNAMDARMKHLLTSWLTARAALAVGAACACAAYAAPVVPAADLILSRTNGVAPLAVFFDASDTTSAVTAIPFHELDYRWNFGDSGAGAWPTDGRSKNEATGPVAAHVFETPGVYTVTLIVSDIQAQQTTQQMVVTVDDPAVVFAGANTICFSQNGDFSGAPAGALQIVTNRLLAVTNYFVPRRRVLLRRGETWTNTGVRLDAAGPGLIGSFGVGALPVLAVTNGCSVFTLSSSRPQLDDWRIMDLEFNGSLVGAWGIAANGVVTRVLVLRLYVHDFLGGVVIPTSILNYYGTTSMYDQIALADSTLTHFVGGGGGNIGYIESRRLAIQGCVMRDSTGVEHILRTPWISSGSGQRQARDQDARAEIQPARHRIKPVHGTRGAQRQHLCRQRRLDRVLGAAGHQRRRAGARHSG